MPYRSGNALPLRAPPSILLPSSTAPPMAPDRRPIDRPRIHPKKGPGRVVSARLKVTDVSRLDAALDARGLSASDLVRTLTLDWLDSLDAGPADAPT